MKILLCCEFYHPSVGGVQVVIRALAERLAARGHQVTVATSRLTTRTFTTLEGVQIKEFTVSGNLVSGMHGEVGAYRDFVTSGDFDVIMIKAAQQWTFDALWPVIDRIPSVKIFIPCGFSSLFEPGYADYFRKLPGILKAFDHLIFYAENYRDINFAREHGIKHFSIIPNGASEVEFAAQADPQFRTSLGISADDFLFLTVGSFTGLKGHLEAAKAFSLADFEDRPAALILNGNKCGGGNLGLFSTLIRGIGIIKSHGLKYLLKHAIKTSLRSVGLKVGKDDELLLVLRSINSQQGKKAFITDLERQTLIQAFINADLFVFASNVEYSPLVLYESAAAGTPFLTVPVGNSEEIASWTQAGIVCPASRDSKGYTRVDPLELARHMELLVQDPATLQRLGEAGKRIWSERFTWAKITDAYEELFLRLVAERMA
ncbi:MAG: glycosyltransferase [Desulfuromonadales bacterium]|nr:MAG: glycosyltransferase [Desulfuromonadales bacterium]